MNRRSFLAHAAGLSMFIGCGSSGPGHGFGFSGAGNPALLNPVPAQPVSGRIEPELVISGSEVTSVYGPSTVLGSTFTTSIAPTTVGLLVLTDGAGVRGFALTSPGEVPVFSAESSALAIVFMEPGFLRLDPSAARGLIARIRASSEFTAFVQILLSNAQTRRLDQLSGDVDFAAAREALVQSLGNPFTASNPKGEVEYGGLGTISNPSPRFLQVVSDDRPAPRLLPPYGALGGALTKSNYIFHGLGPASTLPEDTSLIESTYFPTLVFAVILPLLELAIGQEIPVETGLVITSRLRQQALAPREDLVSTQALASSMANDIVPILEDLSNAIATVLAELEAAGLPSQVAVGFVLTSLIKFKQHKENPTSVPIGSPVSLLFIAAALLFLPSILNTAGYTLFGDSSGQTPGPPV